jgi:hypothetical protein
MVPGAATSVCLMKLSARRRVLVPATALSACLCVAVSACGSEASEEPLDDSPDAAGLDASNVLDATSSDAGDHAATDASGGATDGSVDSTAPDARAPDGATFDSGEGDGSVEDGSDGSDGAPADGAPADGGPDGGVSAACAAILAQHLGSPIAPPYRFAGFDFASSPADAGPVATSITTLDPDDCYPAIPETYKHEPGFTMHGATGIQLYTNLDTDDVGLLTADPSFTGSMTFDTLASSRYGKHHYVARIGSLTKDGAPFVIDWSSPDPSLEELYTGLMDTFAPGQAPDGSCLDSGACLQSVSPPVFGVRAPLNVYMAFAAGTAQPDRFYMFDHAADATCATPLSIAEQWTYAPIGAPEASGIGGLTLTDSRGDANLTPAAANAALCLMGVHVQSSATISWASDAFTLTYNIEPGTLDYGLGTKLAAGAGYKGYFYADTADEQHEYAVAIGSLTYDGADVDLLAGGDAAITAFSNAVRATYYGDGSSSDCITDTYCTLTSNAALGQTTLTTRGLAFVFSTATHEPVEIDELPSD